MNHGALFDLLDDAVALSLNHLTLKVGIDRVEIETFTQLLASGGEEFLSEVYRSDEINYCSGRIERPSIGTSRRFNCRQYDAYKIRSGGGSCCTARCTNRRIQL